MPGCGHAAVAGRGRPPARRQPGTRGGHLPTFAAGGPPALGRGPRPPRASLARAPVAAPKPHSRAPDPLRHADRLPDALVELVVGSAEGNPFYIEELVTWLVDAGVVVRGDPHWLVVDELIRAVAVPSTLRGVLQSRLDALGHEERHLLQRASVVGRVFWDRAVAHLEGAADDSVAQASLDHLRDGVVCGPLEWARPGPRRPARRPRPAAAGGARRGPARRVAPGGARRVEGTATARCSCRRRASGLAAYHDPGVDEPGEQLLDGRTGCPPRCPRRARPAARGARRHGARIWRTRVRLSRCIEREPLVVGEALAPARIGQQRRSGGGHHEHPAVGGARPRRVPTSLEPTPTGNGSVTLSWNANPASDQVNTYQVYYGTVASFSTFSTFIDNVTGTNYTVTGLTNGTTYYFKVSAHNSVGYGPWSATAVGATPTATTTPPAATNLALRKPATASSVGSSPYSVLASNAFDGNLTSRWSSAFSDPQWLQVDLGSTQSISSVVITWETAYAKAFQIQTSNDAKNWTTIYSTTSGKGGTQTLTVSGSGRYVRMYGTQRATNWGYSIFEMAVYGPAAGTSGGGSAPPSSPVTSTGSVNFPSSVNSLTVTAKGDQCGGAPQMNVTIDGTNFVSAASVSSTSDHFLGQCCFG